MWKKMESMQKYIEVLEFRVKNSVTERPQDAKGA
jgi:hypothetical protein